MTDNTRSSAVLLGATALFSLISLPSLHAQSTRGLPLFEIHCAKCHGARAAENRAPSREELTLRTPESVLEAITNGQMEPMAHDLNSQQKRMLAEAVTGRTLGTAMAGAASSMPNRCSDTVMADPTKGPGWNGWGADSGNTRFQPAEAAGLTETQVPRLKLKWVFGVPGAGSMFGQPTVAGGRIYFGSDTGIVYSINAATGCVYWSFQARAGVRSAITIAAVPRSNPARYAIYFGDLKANAYAVDAANGAEIWHQHAESHPVARITGAPTFYDGLLYVPVASVEEDIAAQPDYECCTFRGSIVAYDAASGKQLWKTYTIPEPLKRVKKTSKGTQLWGPAGVGVWSSPTIDTKRSLLYVATGNAYTAPAAATSDAVLAIDLKTGRMVWSKQLLFNDASITCQGTVFNGNVKNRSENCPPVEGEGPDFDFAQSPILSKLSGGRDIIVVGQKSGMGWALDPQNKGALLWSNRVGHGTYMGGITWGSATDGHLVFFANSDINMGASDAGGLAAIDIESGERVWYTRPPAIPCTNARDAKCIQAQSAATTAIPGVVFSGATNGIMRAYSSATGKIIWEYNTARDFEAVNGIPTHGGTLNGPGPTVVNGLVYIPSGYSVYAGQAGNALLAFGVD